MKIKIQSIHFDADRKLVEFITEKVLKLEHYHDKIIDATVYLKLNNHHTKANKHVEIKINILHSTLFKDAEAETFEAATDIVMDTLKVQIRKHKERLLEKTQKILSNS
jgi:putative sigma-54 modulation protein